MRCAAALALLLAAALAAPGGGAASEAPANSTERALKERGDKGYWFYQEPPPRPRVRPPRQRPPEEAKAPRPHPPEPRKPDRKACQDEATWVPECGFITPKTYAFQAKMRDALLQRMVMHPEDPDAVLAFQRYNRWVFYQALHVARVWKHNLLRMPEELDATAFSPISAFGLQLAHTVRARKEQTVWQALRDWGAFLVVFTKHDCLYCQKSVSPLMNLEIETGLPLWEAPLEGGCFEYFAERDRCLDEDLIRDAARILQVSIVPMLYLYIPDNTWIRITAGFETTDVMAERIYNLVIAWRLAALKGMQDLDLNPRHDPKTLAEVRRLLRRQIEAGGLEAAGGGPAGD